MKSISGKKFAKLLESKGWILLRVNGSHLHGNKVLKIGLLRHFRRW